jgi:hypothetical protein
LRLNTDNNRNSRNAVKANDCHGEDVKSARNLQRKSVVEPERRRQQTFQIAEIDKYIDGGETTYGRDETQER